MSHELRTPLNAVLGFSELMSNEVFGPLGASCYSTYAKDIHASGRLLLKSAEDALAITALLTGTDAKRIAVPTSLETAVAEALQFCRPDLDQRGIEVVCNLDGDCAVASDAQTLRQILINIIADAAKQCRDGGRLTINANETNRGVCLAISLPTADAADTASTDTFCMTLAGTLCELSGAMLSCSRTANDGIERSITFPLVLQSDLF
jgi:two-component system cell cycle sensor histidine kinase PleC